MFDSDAMRCPLISHRLAIMEPWPCSWEEARIKWCLRLPCHGYHEEIDMIVFKFLLWGKRSKAIPDPSIQSVSYNCNIVAICRTVPKAARAI